MGTVSVASTFVVFGVLFAIRRLRKSGTKSCKQAMLDLMDEIERTCPKSVVDGHGNVIKVINWPDNWEVPEGAVRE